MVQVKKASRHINLGLIASAVYLSLFVLICTILIFALTFQIHYSAFERRFAFLPVYMTLPWSAWETRLAEFPGYSTLNNYLTVRYNHLDPVGKLFGYGFFNMLGLLPGALINAMILYWSVNFVVKIVTNHRSRRKRLSTR